MGFSGPLAHYCFSLQWGLHLGLDLSGFLVDHQEPYKWSPECNWKGIYWEISETAGYDFYTYYPNMESYPYLIKTKGDLGWGRRRSPEEVKGITASEMFSPTQL